MNQILLDIPNRHEGVLFDQAHNMAFDIIALGWILVERFSGSRPYGRSLELVNYGYSSGIVFFFSSLGSPSEPKAERAASIESYAMRTLSNSSKS